MRGLRVGLTVVVAVLGGLVPVPASAAPSQVFVAPELVTQAGEAAEGGRPVEAIVGLAAEPDLTAAAGDAPAVAEVLRQTAEESQPAFEAALAADPGLAGARVLNRLWLGNTLLVELPAATASQQLGALAALPGVGWLAPNPEVRAADPEQSQPGPAVVMDRTWGIDRIQAHRVWSELGVDGSGVRVATLDTGVDIAHPDLAGRMVTADPADPAHPGGWMEFDRFGQRVRSTPHDSQSHGTHVSGTIHGGRASGVAVGVAPGAQLMHGLVLPGGFGMLFQILAGMQWAMAPVDAAGNRTGEPADVINMSLSQLGFHPAMVAPTRAIRAAGIVPAFSIGNDCPQGGTGNPGNVYDAFGVGSTDRVDTVPTSSCGGVVRRGNWPNPPAEWPDSYVKPDLTAPGVDVYSTVPGGGYGYLSGTSMATPHVAGVAALMLSAGVGVTVDDVAGVLARTAVFDARHGFDRPNTRLGHGRVDAYRAVSAVALRSGVAGRLTDAVSGRPIEGATVTAEHTGRSARTGHDGRYRLLLPPGGHDLTVRAFGYVDAGLAGVTVVAGEFTTADRALDPAPGGTLTGTVRYTDTGRPVPGARVTLTAPAGPAALTGADGRYTLSGVPEGRWRLAVSSAALPDPAPVEVTVVADRTATVDVDLRAPLPTVGLLGDDLGMLRGYLASVDVEAVPIAWGDDVTPYGTVVVNYAAGVTEEQFTALLAATDAAGVGVIFLDTWFWDPFGVSLLVEYLGSPASRGQDGGAWVTGDLYYQVAAEHPIFAGHRPGDRVTIDQASVNRFHAWFDGYTGEGRQVIAELGRTDAGLVGGAVGVQQRANNRHVLLSAHGVTTGNNPSTWTADAGRVFTNALEWAGPVPDPSLPRFVEWDLRVDRDVTTSGEPVLVSADVTNFGGSTASHEVELLVDGAVEASTAVTLAPGETRTVSWPVRRTEPRPYQLGVGALVEQFRVRPPLVDLLVSTVDGGGPLAGASVALVRDGRLLPVGVTDAAGRLTFEAAAAEHTVVAQRAAANGNPSYLLVRHARIDRDAELTLAPRTAAKDTPPADQAAVLELTLDPVAGTHRARSYLRHPLTGPLGFAVPPGRVVLTVGAYDVRHVHTVAGFERDWWGVSDTAAGVDFGQPQRYRRQFGGQARATLAALFGSGTRFTARWSVTDAHGNPFATMATTDPRYAAASALPDWVVLEDVPGLLRHTAPRQADPILRLFDPADRQIHGGALSWDQRTLTRDLAEFAGPVQRGRYTLQLTLDTGGYRPPTLTATARLTIR